MISESYYGWGIEGRKLVQVNVSPPVRCTQTVPKSPIVPKLYPRDFDANAIFVNSHGFAEPAINAEIVNLAGKLLDAAP